MSIHSGVPVSSLINLHVCPRDSHEYLEQVFPSLPHFAQSAPPRGGCHGLHSNVTLTFLTSPIPNALNITITIITTTTIIIPIVNNVPAAAPKAEQPIAPNPAIAPPAVPAANREQVIAGGNPLPTPVNCRSNEVNANPIAAPAKAPPAALRPGFTVNAAPLVVGPSSSAPTCARLRLPSIPAPVAVPAAHTSATPIMPATVPAIPN